MKNDPKRKSKPASAEKKLIEARDEKIDARLTEYGDAECVPQTFGLVEDEIEIEDGNDWITITVTDPEQPEDVHGPRYSFKASQVIGYTIGRDDDRAPYFAIFTKHLPSIVLEMWNMEQAVDVYEKFQEVMQDFAQREPTE